MSRFVLELLDASHDRKSFASGLASVDDYLKRTARGHTEKGVSLTRVLVTEDATPPKPILGYFTLTPCMVEAAGWPEVPKGLPRNPVGAVLLGRLAVDASAHGQGIATRLLALSRRIAADSLGATGGIGMVVDAATEDLVGFYQRFGFRRIATDSLRLFLPTRSLVTNPAQPGT
ncbi:MAG TPA: GNAT family N-acetyltransferase [Luteolibacter sp.]|nr:GNAT family N-acetyltransferase [Luteolibacter sp.]